MHHCLKNSHIKFRAAPILATALSKAAAKRGMNLSEFMRSIASEKVGLN